MMAKPLRSWLLCLGCAVLVGSFLGSVAQAARAERTGDPLALSSGGYFKVRLAAARLLGRHEDRQSTLGLHALLSDPHPLGLTVALTALEFLGAVLQAYVFAVLNCVYLSDAVHGGH